MRMVRAVGSDMYRAHAAWAGSGQCAVAWGAGAEGAEGARGAQ